MIGDAEFEKRLERHRQAAAKLNGKPVTKSDEYYGGRLEAMTPDDFKRLFTDCDARGLWADTGRYIGTPWMTLRKMAKANS